jgi:aquaporin Z
MRKYVIEFIGTFFLVLAVCAAVRSQQELQSFAPLFVGLVLMAMTYAGRSFSGAHYNPAVSLAFFIRRKIRFVDMIGYWAIQLMAGVVGALVAAKVFNYETNTTAVTEPIAAIIAEMVGTFALTFVILCVTTSKRSLNNDYYGLAIGSVVVAMAYIVGPVSGGVFNPSVALGLSVFEKLDWNSLWIYLVGSITGAAIAAILYKILRMDIE